MGKKKHDIDDEECEKYLDAVADFINQTGCILADNSEKIINTVIRLGYVCPCRLGKVPCPCEFAKEELETQGKCHCGLFVRK